MNAIERTKETVVALEEWWASGNRTMHDKGLTLVFDAPPEVLLNPAGEPAGVDAMVRAFRAGSEIKVDPHRRFWNLPLVHDGKVDPLGAYREVLFGTLRSRPHPRGWRTKGTVDTFYAGTADGELTSQSASFSTARSGGGSLSSDTGGATFIVQASQVDSNFVLREAFLSFDTSSIGSDPTVSEAVLELYVTGKNAPSSWALLAYLLDWGASLTTGDWVTGATLAVTTEVCSQLITSLTPTSQYVEIAENSGFLTASIHPTGTTYLVLAHGALPSNTAPGSGVVMNLTASSANASGTTQDPRLIVTHELPLVNATITGVSAGMSMAANAGVVSTVRAVSVTGVQATQTLSAGVGVVFVVPIADIQGQPAGMALEASVGVVQTVQFRTVTGEPAALALSAPIGVVSAGPPEPGRATSSETTAPVRVRALAPSVTLSATQP